MLLPLAPEGNGYTWLEAPEIRRRAALAEEALRDAGETLRSLAGEAYAGILYGRGLADGRALARAGLAQSRWACDKRGFAAAARHLAEGLGSLRVVEEPEDAALIVEAGTTFESRACQGQRQDHPCCDYTRGALAGLMGELLPAVNGGSGGIVAIETHCAGKGDDRCRFAFIAAPDHPSVPPLPASSLPSFADPVSHQLSPAVSHGIDPMVLNALSEASAGALDTDRLLRRAAQKVLELTGFNGCAFYLADGERREARLAHVVGPGSRLVWQHARRYAYGQGIVGTVCQAGEPLYIGSLSGEYQHLAHPALNRIGIRSFATIPLRAGGSFLGVIHLVARCEREVSAVDRQLLETVGALLGGMLANARLYEQARARERQQRLENAIASQLRRSLDTDEVCETAVREFCRGLQASQCYLVEIDGDLVHIAHEHHRASVLPVGGTFPLETIPAEVRRRLARGQILAVEDVTNDPYIADYYKVELELRRVRSMLMVPLIMGRECRAILVVHQSDRRRRWTDDDIRLARTAAGHTALALENARLFERTRLSEQRYMALYNEAPDMYHTTDADGRIILCNDTMVRTLGYAREELIGRPWLELCTGAARAELESQPGANGTMCWLTETRLRCKDGSDMDVSVRAVCIEEDGRCVGARVVMRDITNQRRLERQLLQAQKMESLGTLAGGIAHDFNNLLAGITGYAVLIKQETDPTEPIHQFADNIEKSGQHAASLTRRMLDFARPEPPQTRPINLNDVVRDALGLLSRSFRRAITLSLDLAADLAPTQADPVQMQQVLINLCVNARDAMPCGGNLTITTRNVPAEQTARLGLPDQGACVALSVTDTGHGMDEATRARIFDPFFTTKGPGKGTGLGLSGVYGIISRHQGRIEVRSEPGQGATFAVYLPAMSEPVSVHLRESAASGARAKSRLLVVDDEPVVRTLLRDLLLGHGRDVLVAESGKEALAIYRERGKEIDLVLLDMMMPEMGGGETFRRLRDIDPEARVILLSGYADEAEVRDLLASGARGYLRKPCSMRELHAAIRKATR